MRSHLKYLLFLILFLAAPILAQEEKPPALQELKQEEQLKLEKIFAGMRSIGTLPIEQVLRFDLENEELVLMTQLGPMNGPARMKIEDLPGFTSLRVQPVKMQGGQIRSVIFDLQHYDLSAPDSVMTFTHVLSSPGQVQIVRNTQKMGESLDIQLLQGGYWRDVQFVRLYVKAMNDDAEEPSIDLQLSAPTLGELQRRYPREIEQYLRPIFADLHQAGNILGIDPQTAWQVLGEDRKPDPRLVAQINTLIAKFDADSFQEREIAFESLRELGQPAALYLIRHRPVDLSPEQSSRIDAFLSSYQPLSKEEIERLRKSPDFLLDCLYNEDKSIRAGALDQLGKLLGRPIEFDVNADKKERSAAIAALRAAIKPPATVPSAQP